jgi:hypothetical protein
VYFILAYFAVQLFTVELLIDPDALKGFAEFRLCEIIFVLSSLSCTNKMVLGFNADDAVALSLSYDLIID